MSELRKNWNREELILAINLYCKIPFGKIHFRNPDLINLAQILNRSPSAVAWKLVNFASLDPSLKQRGIKGAVNSSKLDKEIWDEFYNNWGKLSFESELLLAKFSNTSLKSILDSDEINLFKEGKEKQAILKVRINQVFFRSTILASYNFRCAITGITQNELLIASHVVPWSRDEKNRLNPRNGICINALHDKAFDRGLITITTDYKIKSSSKLKKYYNEDFISMAFKRYENQVINLPSRFLPDPILLEFHNNEIFQG